MALGPSLAGRVSRYHTRLYECPAGLPHCNYVPSLFRHFLFTCPSPKVDAFSSPLLFQIQASNSPASSTHTRIHEHTIQNKIAWPSCRHSRHQSRCPERSQSSADSHDENQVTVMLLHCRLPPCTPLHPESCSDALPSPKLVSRPHLIHQTPS